MKSYVMKGDTIDWTNDTGADVATGTPLVVGALIGVPETDIANGESGALNIDGVHRLAKAAGEAFAVGDAAGVNGANEIAAGTGAVAVAAAAAGDATVDVKLNA